jgi:hypothetical protein
LKKAQKSRALERMLNVVIPPETYEALGEVLDGVDT